MLMLREPNVPAFLITKDLELGTKLKRKITNVAVVAENKKQLADHYSFTEGWYDALLNSDYTIRNNQTEHQIKLDPAEKTSNC